MKHTYHISGMTCNGCKSHVEEILLSVEGVKGVSVNLEHSEAEITMENHVPLEMMQKVLKEDGGRYGISVDGHNQHHHHEKELNQMIREKEVTTALCFVKAINNMTTRVIALFAVWT